ncbi:MAG TPA: hypothetical protein PLZ57_08795 [Pseudobdellovibrionaceae bacterium]|nr:hypothetical protein [Pseudobdellovibrionaceae bacterium]
MNTRVWPLNLFRLLRVVSLSLVVVSAFPEGAVACECSEKVWNELRTAPEKARIAALVRRRSAELSLTSPGAVKSNEPAKGQRSGGAKPSGSDGVVPLEVIPLNATPLTSYRRSGSSCDVEISEGRQWWLLLSQNEPNDALKSCRTLVFPIERAGELIDRLAKQIPSTPLPNPAWLICNETTDCAMSPESGCIGRLSVNRRHLDLVQQWRKKVEPMISCPSPAARQANAQQKPGQKPGQQPGQKPGQQASGQTGPSTGEEVLGEPRCVNQLCQ